MSITYPEAQPISASKRASSAAIMNSGSALFPSGSTGVYERASKARASKNTPLAWVAAPVAIVLIGGGIYLAATHRPASPATSASRSATTTITTSPAANTPTPASSAPALKVQPADTTAPVTTHTRVVQKSAEQVTQPVARATPPAIHVTRSTTVIRQVQAPAAAPAPAPVVAAPAPATSAPTPGTFNLTPAPAASAPSTTPDVVTPPAAAAPAPSTDSAPQASPQA